MPRLAGHSKLGIVIWLVLAASGRLLADEPIRIPHRQDQPPNPPRSPQEAIRRMTVPEGFVVELVASEPDIVNPVAMTFDDRGRIWITESEEYPRQSAGEGRDRIKILEDTNGDGRADQVTLFADGLNIPSGIAVGYGGVWVVNAPDLLYMREQDGKAVDRQVVLTGFGRTDTHELPNSLTWGPDGWLYGLNGVFNHCRVVSGGKEFTFNCALFRVHPRTHEFQLFCEGTSNPWGLAWDTEGSAIISTCHWANDHVFHFVETGYYQRQAGPYPAYTMKIGSISDHSHQKTAYCGLAFFDSHAYPEKYRQRLYTGNIHGGCINVDVLRRDGSTYVSGGEPDFLSANDAWFMPVALKVGPDGSLYILDWYDRYHCSQDARRDPAGVDRLKGRLYRVRYEGTPRAPAFDLATESDAQLVGRLRSPNIYYRGHAQRLLSERNTESMRRRLRDLVLDPAASRKARMHALWSLVGTGTLEPDFHCRLLDHPEPAYRAWGVRAAGNFRNVHDSIRDRVAAMAQDPHPDVQLAVAIASRKIGGLDPLPILIDVLAGCGQDKLIPYIVWPNLHPLLETTSSRFVQLVQRVDLTQSPALARILPRAIDRMLGARRPDFDAMGALVELAVAQNRPCAAECLSILADRSAELSDTALANVQSRLEPILRRILSRTNDDSLALAAQLLAARFRWDLADPEAVERRFVSADEPTVVRLQALDALMVARHASLVRALDRVLSTGPTPFLAKVLPALGAVDDPKVADLVLARYAAMAPELQPLAVDLLLQREPWARRLLDAVRQGTVPSGVLTANHLRKILDSNDREAIWAVEKTWGSVRRQRNPQQERVVAEMAEFLRNNLGDPLAGERVFGKLCAQCHVIYGQGYDVGADLTSNGRASFDQLVSNVFDPSLVIGQGYQVTTVVTNDGRNLSGLVSEENDQRIVLKLQGAKRETIPRSNVKYTRVSELSMMPEGIEKLFDRKELADLFAFLSLDKHPSDPRARPIPGAPDARVNLRAGGNASP